jgi:hypothetical protein
MRPFRSSISDRKTSFFPVITSADRKQQCTRRNDEARGVADGMEWNRISGAGIPRYMIHSFRYVCFALQNGNDLAYKRIQIQTDPVAGIIVSR